jgi:hypothetical protein
MKYRSRRVDELHEAGGQAVRGGRVLTLDLPDFGVVARAGAIHVLPE